MTEPGTKERQARARSPRRARRMAVAAIVLGVGVAPAGCATGSDDGEKIPPDAAEQLRATASTIDQATQEQSCEVAHAATTDLRRQVDELKATVEPKIHDTLGEMVTSLDELLDVECPQTGTSEREQEPEELEEPVTPTAPTTPAPPPEEETEEEPQETEKDEEDADDGPPSNSSGQGPGPTEPKPVPPGQEEGTPPTGGLDTERAENRAAALKQANSGSGPKKKAG